MARSTYIYLAMDTHDNITAFTVKHEMISFVKRNEGLISHVYRVRDGVPYSETIVDPKDYRNV
jgi:hypothetical protein